MAKDTVSAAEIRVEQDARPRARGPSWGCAELCMKEILLRFGKTAALVELAKLMDASDRGASFADLVRVSKKKGLKAVPWHLSVEELKDALLGEENPCIVHLKWGGGHFAIAEAVEGKIRLLDPPKRVWKTGLEILQEAFSGHALFFEEATASRAKSKKKVEKKSKKKAKKKSKKRAKTSRK